MTKVYEIIKSSKFLFVFRMKKELHPEWILSLPEPAIGIVPRCYFFKQLKILCKWFSSDRNDHCKDGVIVDDHIFVLTTKNVYQYELSSRLLHGSFSVEFGELNSLSMQKVRFIDKTGLLITKRCGNIQERVCWSSGTYHQLLCCKVSLPSWPLKRSIIYMVE